MRMLSFVDKLREKFRKSAGTDCTALSDEVRSTLSDHGSTHSSDDKSMVEAETNLVHYDQTSENANNTKPLQNMQSRRSNGAIFHHVMEPFMFTQQGFNELQCNIFLSQDSGDMDDLKVRTFTTSDSLIYEPFCDDFGPMSMQSIIGFIAILDSEIFASRSSRRNVIYIAQQGRRHLTNAAFLLGAYMILKLNQDPDFVQSCFSALDPSAFEGYRDATYSTPRFRLQLIDCWRGLFRGKSNGWVALPSHASPTMWGQIDAVEYERYDNYLNGDLHIVVPDKFVAFKGPKHVADGKYKDIYRDGKFYSRDFSPQYYSEIFEEIGVTTVIRLNDLCYQRRNFIDSGIEHHDLFFEDCTAPPASIVSKFFEIVDQAEGLVAIHCKAGLGRTGTLIALYLMRTYGFSGREAMGWLRIMRPGSVIGEQQAFLCAVEECAARASVRGDVASPPTAPRPRASSVSTSDSPDAAAGRHVRFHHTTKQAPGSPALGPLPPRPSLAGEYSRPMSRLPKAKDSEGLMEPTVPAPLSPVAELSPSPPPARVTGNRLAARSFYVGRTPSAPATVSVAAAQDPASAAAAAGPARSESSPAVLAEQIAIGMDRRGAAKALRAQCV